MKTQPVCLALAILLLCPFASAQRVQTGSTNDRQRPHHPLMGPNAFREMPREEPGLPAHHRQPTEFISRLDSVRAQFMRAPFPYGKSIPNGVQTALHPFRKTSSPQSQIYVIDTAIVKSSYSDTTRHLYTFNPKAKKTSDLTQKLAGGNWVDASRETNTYDERSNMLTDVYQVWSDDHWIMTQSNTYTYDANGNLLSLLYEPYCLMGDCADGGRWTYTYDANGNLLSDLWQILWDSTSDWENVYTDTYTYDAKNNLVTILSQNWSIDQWLNQWREMYTYDANNNMVATVTGVWSNGQWLDQWRATCTYDGSNNMLSSMYENWSNSEWVFEYRLSYTYDIHQNMLSCLRESWSTGQWLNSGRETYTYDSSNDLLSYLYEEWSGGQWMNDEQKTYNYDAQGNLASFWNYTWLNGSWTPRDIGGRGYGLIVTDSAGNSYGYIGYNFEFSHRLIVTGVTSHNSNLPADYSLSQNYPNPFNPKTTIGYSVGGVRLQASGISDVRLSVYDILGREVAVLVDEPKAPGTYEVTFNGSNLSSGVYLYRLQAGSYVDVKKLVLLK